MLESSDIPVRMAEELNGGRQEVDIIVKRCSNYVQGVESESTILGFSFQGICTVKRLFNVV
jgi:hypothetical protein